ncbi:MAG TPA: CYTH domain-containing protein [Candidatus Paceibacterota bacterium]|jgi:adenylate cyclase class IV|nr:CYTH domain-containing protein [Candidatus Paceibacterota bacterium]
MQSYEVEVKSLLGSGSRADELREAMKKIDPICELQSKNKQLNHYFEGGTLKKLAEVVAPHLSGIAGIKLDDMVERAKEFSLRTRDKNGSVYLVVKASVGQDSSQNGVARMEFEEKMDASLDELDKLVLSAGFHYQAKWSREREEYLCKNVNVTLDKNAGYGWLAEFELVVDDPLKVEAARSEVMALMQELGVEELPQPRLERMFDYYNTHWQEFYGTDRIFTVE